MPFPIPFLACRCAVPLHVATVAPHFAHTPADADLGRSLNLLPSRAKIRHVKDVGLKQVAERNLVQAGTFFYVQNLALHSIAKQMLAGAWVIVLCV